MLETFVGFLRTRADLVRTADLDDNSLRKIDALVSELDALGSARGSTGWDRAYRTERELVLMLKGEVLHQRIKDLLDEADDRRVPSRVRLRAMYTDALQRLYDRSTPPNLVTGADDILRYLANTILEDSQWYAKQRFLAIPQRTKATSRIVTAGLIGFFLFLAPILVISVSAAFAKINPALNVADHVRDWSGLILWNVLAAGLLGATFSRLLYLQTGVDTLTLEELENAQSWRSILLRSAVGMIGALVVFYFLESGLIDGTLVPDASQSRLYFTEADGAAPANGRSQGIVLPNAQLALLAVWCFLAGFSERIVPDVLSAAEGQVNTTVTKKPAGGI
jgi:hypothetical protein